MRQRSSFEKDLEKERQLSVLLDSCYSQNLKNYSFERISDLQQQLHGIDVVFTNLKTKEQFFVDEKAQLDYVNEALPTFAFELRYYKRNVSKKGWLFDMRKKTDFYALVTSIYSDAPKKFTSCKITFVNRKKLIAFLAERKLTEKSLFNLINATDIKGGKHNIKALHSKKEGYLYFTGSKKAEKPINLVLKLDFLILNGLAKRFV